MYSYNTMLEFARKFISIEKQLSNFMTTIFNIKDSEKKVSEILLIQTSINNEIFKHIYNYIPDTKIFTTIKEFESNYITNHKLSIINIDDIDYLTENIRFLVFNSSSSIILVNENIEELRNWIDLFLPLINDINITYFDIVIDDIVVDNKDKIYSKYFREVALSRRKKILEKKYEEIVRTILIKMNHYANKGILNFRLDLKKEIDVIQPFFYTLTETKDYIKHRIENDKRFSSEYFKVRSNSSNKDKELTEFEFTF